MGCMCSHECSIICRYLFFLFSFFFLTLKTNKSKKQDKNVFFFRTLVSILHSRQSPAAATVSLFPCRLGKRITSSGTPTSLVTSRQSGYQSTWCGYPTSSCTTGTLRPCDVLDSNPCTSEHGCECPASSCTAGKSWLSKVL